MTLDLWELREFGQAADQLQQPALAEGGFLVLGAGSVGASSRRREQHGSHVGQGPGAEEARSAAGSRTGRPASAAATGAAAYPVERGLSAVLGLEELFAWHHDARWVGSSSSYAFLLVQLGLFRSIPERATLLLEIPTRKPDWLRGRREAYAPFIRAWANWSWGRAVRGHHEFPDESMCVCREENWVLGQHVIEDYVGYCTCWVAKSLHERLLGWWPGLQHCPAAVRVERGALSEYCGCGRPVRYKLCCRSKDLAGKWISRAVERIEANRKYLQEVARRGLPPQRPGIVIPRSSTCDLFISPRRYVLDAHPHDGFGRELPNAWPLPMASVPWSQRTSDDAMQVLRRPWQ